MAVLRGCGKTERRSWGRVGQRSESDGWNIGSELSPERYRRDALIAVMDDRGGLDVNDRCALVLVLDRFQ